MDVHAIRVKRGALSGIDALRSPSRRYMWGQENSAFDPCVRAFNCVRLRLRKFNLRALVP